MKNKRLLIVLGTAIALCTGLFFSFFEPYEEIKDEGWSETALRNPFLAAQQYLEHDSKEVQVSRSLQAVMLEQAIDTIIISNLNNIVSELLSASLKDWVESGGHLVLSGMYSELNSAPADFINWLDVSLYENDPPCSKKLDEELTFDELSPVSEENNLQLDDAIEQTETEKSCDGDSYRSLTTLSFYGQPEIGVNFDSQYGLYHPSLDDLDFESEAGYQLNHWFSSEYSVHFLQFTFAKGTISILSDVEIWQNSNIDRTDHAFLLTHLTNNSNLVRFVVGNNMPSLFALMWRYGSEFLVSILLLVVVWLLYRTQRLAPPVQARSVNRRSIAEHIKACANFHWQRKDTQALLLSLQAEIEQLAGRSVGRFTHLSKADQCEAIAAASGISPDKISQALQETCITNEASFTDVVKTLQMVRKRLGKKSDALTENYS